MSSEPLNYSIRPATEADFPAILGLIKELAEFEKAPEKVRNSVEQMKAEKDYFEALVAEKDDGEIIGMALYFYAYYTWVGKSMYLDDLYVKEKYRGRGVGKALLNRVIDTARKNNCKRLRWQVLEWNTPAIEFYKKMGVTLDDEWINCDLEF
ncbi:MAG: GNAT family N-acetyltransferase [Chlorobi bacterium]|nr:GNAT family N-acetyltransferase [Chlorobiota bacterium]